MRVLLIGSGGREHALAWKILQSPRLTRLHVLPGNAGTARHNVELPADDHSAIVDCARSAQIDLVIIGPEAPLAAGLADDLRAAGIKVFGPSRAAAEIESSKAFAKAFMARHNIPTARFACFTEATAALEHLRGVDYPVVIKASGLAAGKGVILPNDAAGAEAAIRSIMLDREFGPAGEEVVIEERLTGEEVSLLCFTDGQTVKPMPPVQDHKRLLDGDLGPNTGGMGAYAPAPVCPPAQVAQLIQTVLQPTVDGLRAEGRTFVGALYAGVMLTASGPSVLEFNCRFGDPETQVLMPLLDSDLLAVAEACAEGRLSEVDLRWKGGFAACVVAAAAGYPGRYPTGDPILGLEADGDRAVFFHAGTKIMEGQVVTTGGRVLAATGWDDSVESAVRRAYEALSGIRFAGMQFRRDIGWRAIGSGKPTEWASVSESPGSARPLGESAYAAAGVDIDAGNRAVELMRGSARATYGSEILAGIGAFGGLYSAGQLKQMDEPVLVASTDGVGTKVKLASRAGRFDSLGHDLVNHCINDILVQGARPLFFLDYIASSRLDPAVAAAIVQGIAAACRDAGCALLGGETAEMPGVYLPGELDLAGTIVGVVERGRILPRGDLRAGDVLLGLRSCGPHTNGYSLIRRVFGNSPLDTIFPELDMTLVDALLAPHRSYFDLLHRLISEPQSKIKALAHVTGGGLVENLPRILPAGLGALVDRGSWPIPPLFSLIQMHGDIPLLEMYRVFNMGIGMVAILAESDAPGVRAAIPEETYLIGQLVPGDRKVFLA